MRCRIVTANALIITYGKFLLGIHRYSSVVLVAFYPDPVPSGSESCSVMTAQCLSDTFHLPAQTPENREQCSPKDGGH